MRKWAMDRIKEHPQYNQEITDLWNLCMSEIEEGGSESHELELFRNDVEELIKQN